MLYFAYETAASIIVVGKRAEETHDRSLTADLQHTAVTNHKEKYLK